MEFAFDQDETRLRSDLRSFLSEALPESWLGQYNETESDFAVVKRVAPQMAEHGWLTMHWPTAYGGRDASIWQQVVLKEEMALHHEPRGSQYMSTNWIGPSIMLFGTEQQKEEHLPRISRGETFWCQGFSEPDSGSDLASLRTRAVRDGDEFVINGEKIWTSHTPHGEWLFLLTRTDPEAPKHKGISVFLLPMTTPGVKVVPIRTMAGTVGEFAHVFFDDVRVPASGLLGAENEGWKVTVAALSFERLGIPYWVRAHAALSGVQSLAGTRLETDPVVRDHFIRLSIETEVARLLWYRHLSEEHREADATVMSNVARIHGTLASQRSGRFGLEALGDIAEVDEAADWVPLHGQAAENWMFAITSTIAAGTLEIQKNVLATRGLGLPR